MSTDFESYRMGHLARTAEVWRRLLDLGVTNETKIAFDFSFSAVKKTAVEAIVAELSDYELEINSEGLIRKEYSIDGSSGSISWTEEQLLRWVDYLIQVGCDTDCRFEGCGANAP